MPQNFLAIQTLKYLVLSAIGTTASMVSLNNQLNQTHGFLYLQLPLWVIFVVMVALSFVGAFLSLATDTMRDRGSIVGKVFTATTVGIVLSFVILPAFNDEPNVAVMFMTALFGSFSGTVLVYLLARLVNNKDLHNAVIEIISDGVLAIIKRFTGGKK